MLYCPICFNETLALKSRGIIRIEINGKHLPNSVFVYDLESEALSAIIGNLSKKVEDFIKWYQSLSNREAISAFTIYSTDFCCTRRCSLNPNSKLSVIGPLFTKEEAMKVLQDVCQKYDVPIKKIVTLT